MVEILGRILNVKSRGVTIGRFNYEAYLDQTASWEYEEPPLSFGPQITLRFADTVIDDLVENACLHLVCKFTVKNGVITSVKPFKTIEEIKEDYRKKREGIRTVLYYVEDAEKRGDVADVSIDLILDLCRIGDGMSEDETRRIIAHLVRTGVLYESRKGFVKKT